MNRAGAPMRLPNRNLNLRDEYLAPCAELIRCLWPILALNHQDPLARLKHKCKAMLARFPSGLIC